MNANGTRFHLLLGREDWGRCLDGDVSGARTLEQRWGDAPSGIPQWDAERNELQLRAEQITLPPTPRERPLLLEARRNAAADRHGNIYWIGPDRSSLYVWSVGSRRDSEFWPPDTTYPGPHDSAREDFQVLAAPVSAQSVTLLALTVTEDHYLVVAFARGVQRGFHTFDLAAGGPPVELLWPWSSFEPFDMAPRCCGGVWVLDRAGAARRLWELDGRLAVVSRESSDVVSDAAVSDDFHAVSGPPRELPARSFPGGIDLTAAPFGVGDPIAIEMLGCNRVLLLVLDRDASGPRSRILQMRRTGAALQVQSSGWFAELAHDFVLAEAHERTPVTTNTRSLFVATTTGNQALAFALDRDAEKFELRRQVNLFPLRRYFGRALLAVQGRAHYDSGESTPRWIPVVQQPRARCEEFAEFVTPVFDASEARTTWDRIVLDACVPPDTHIEVESRAAEELLVANEAPVQLLGDWQREPDPCLRSGGTELPWLRDTAARQPRHTSGVGSWELLLQNAHGRYLQLRLRLLSGNGVSTPHLRALRVWAPRFSYSQRFLPGLYREDAAAAGFLERWLANFEGTLTGIEDRVVQSQVLFDARSAPAAALGWLLQWFDVAFDPAWDDARRRLFVRRAMDFFRWRGTTHGLRIALELAFDSCVDERLFDGPGLQERPQAIRLVETFMTRLIGAVAAGDPQVIAAGPQELRVGVRWQPAEGNAGLADRYAKHLGRAAGATSVEQMTPFSLLPPSNDATTDAATQWREFIASVLGFVPVAGAQEQSRWRHYLYATAADDSEQPETPADLRARITAEVLPRDWPQNARRRDQWRAFCALDDGTRVRARWVDFLARRYRRIEQLNRAYQTHWPSFDVVALPDVLPATVAAQIDWLQFEGQLLAMHRTAHRFSVLLPVVSANEPPDALDERIRLAQRIVNLEKPAHTIFDVRLYWALNRIGAARLGLDTLLGQGSRAAELIPYAQLGRAYIGASFVAGPKRPDGDRVLIEC